MTDTIVLFMQLPTKNSFSCRPMGVKIKMTLARRVRSVYHMENCREYQIRTLNLSLKWHGSSQCFKNTETHAIHSKALIVLSLYIHAVYV